jgi:hypothetical protein
MRRPDEADLDAIFEAMTGDPPKSLRAACRERGVNHAHVLAVVKVNPQVRDQYVLAREAVGEHYGDQVTNVASGVLLGKIEVDRARVAIDAYKWTAGRMAPKVYGDKQQHEHTGPGGGPIQTVDLSKVSDDDLRRLEHVLGVVAEPGTGAGAAIADPSGADEAQG